MCEVYAGAFQNGIMTRKNFSTSSFLAHLFHNFHCYRLALCSIPTIVSVWISEETIPTIQIKTSVIGVNGQDSGARSRDFFCFMLMQHFFLFLFLSFLATHAKWPLLIFNSFCYQCITFVFMFSCVFFPAEFRMYWFLTSNPHQELSKLFYLFRQ